MTKCKKRRSTDTPSSERNKKSIRESNRGPGTGRSSAALRQHVCSDANLSSRQQLRSKADEGIITLPLIRTRMSRRSASTTALNISHNLTLISNDSNVWTLRSTTCLSLGLHPDIHRNIICEGCQGFYSIKLSGNLKIHNTIIRAKVHICQQP